MKWTTMNEKKLLGRAFLFGLAGILLSLTPLLIYNVSPTMDFYSGWLSGLGIGCQLLAMSLAVLVLRKRKISKEIQQKAKQMTLVLAVSLLFFFLI